MEILAQLSAGGMGSVLLARRKGALGFEKLVAVKTIRTEIAERDDVRSMFLDEARLLARLEHPSVAQVYDFGEQDGTLYLAMEYVAGVTFGELISRHHEALNPLVAARLVSEVCRGLHAAHQLTDLAGRPLGVVHRDISPQNLILTFDGRVKILDFGIALMRDRRAPITQVGIVKGKLSYMAPEQIAGLPVDARTDVYAASIVLHELITGKKLFAGAPTFDRAVPPPAGSVRALPPGLADVVVRGLQNDPDARWQSGEEMAAALDQLVAAAAGVGETTAAFVARTLGEERESQRARLRAVLSGHAAGTPEGRVTATEVDQALSLTSTLEERPAGRKPAAAEDASGSRDVIPRRRSFLILPLLALGCGLLLSLLYLHRTSRPADPTPPQAVVADAGAGSGGSPRAPAASRPAATAPSMAAAVARETDPLPDPPRRPARRPARIRVPPRPAPAPAIAPTEPATEVGYLTVGSKDYTTVVIDGVRRGPSPLIKLPLAAGEHELQLLKPVNGELLVKRTLRIAPGEHRYFTYP